MCSTAPTTLFQPFIQPATLSCVFLRCVSCFRRRKKSNNRTYCNSVLTVEIWSRSDIRCIGLVVLVYNKYRGITEKITAKWIHRQVACTRGRVYTCFSSSYSRARVRCWMRTGRRKTGSRLMDCRLIRAMDPRYRLHCRVEESWSEVAHNNEEDVISSGGNARDSQGCPASGSVGRQVVVVGNKSILVTLIDRAPVVNGRTLERGCLFSSSSEFPHYHRQQD